MTYGATEQQAIAAVKALALRVLVDRIEHGEMEPAGLRVISFVPAAA